MTSYHGIHHRLTRGRGSASSHTCANCLTRAAQDWAYDLTDPEEITDKATGLTYSLDLNRYDPLCRPCHRRKDNAAKGLAACGTEAGYNHHRRISCTPPCQPCKDAHAAATRRRLEARATNSDAA